VRRRDLEHLQTKTAAQQSANPNLATYAREITGMEVWCTQERVPYERVRSDQPPMARMESETIWRMKMHTPNRRESGEERLGL
jgi:hypothetical protein